MNPIHISLTLAGTKTRKTALNISGDSCIENPKTRLDSPLPEGQIKREIGGFCTCPGSDDIADVILRVYNPHRSKIRDLDTPVISRMPETASIIPFWRKGKTPFWFRRPPRKSKSQTQEKIPSSWPEHEPLLCALDPTYRT